MITFVIQWEKIKENTVNQFQSFLILCYLTHYLTTNFRLFQLKKFADDNFRFDRNDRKLSKQVENTVGKGEIAHYKQFLLFPQCFERLASQGRQKVSLWGNGLKQGPHTVQAMILEHSDQGPHSSAILKNVLSLILQKNFIYLKVTQLLIG